ncbi:MAG: PKD domain-containing protein [Cyclobacteriaceae bacterium]|nr:PKD domain-containing protein [Cyclobacteriaceae bacterium]
MPLQKIVSIVLFVLISSKSFGYQVSEKNTPGLVFIENKNQWSDNIKYSTQIGNGVMNISDKGFHFIIQDVARLEELHTQSHVVGFYEYGEYECNEETKIDNHSYNVSFVGAKKPHITSQGKTSQYYNYFIGNDSSKWVSYAYGYEIVNYNEIYKNINLSVYSKGMSPKYDFEVNPGGNVKDVQLAYDGVDDIYLFNNQLYIETSLGLVVEDKPYAYQIVDGKRVEVPVKYELDCNVLSFDTPEGYNQNYSLIIDPLLIFSTYSGSTADNWGNSATPGENGTLFSAGVTNLGNTGGTFPATGGAYQTVWGGEYDATIIKFDSTGSQMLFATYLGGSAAETPHSIVMNTAGELVIFGTTSSTNFPTTTNAYDRTFNGGVPTTLTVQYANGSDIFISKLSNDGAQLLASTFVGGEQNDGINLTNRELTENYGDQLRGDVTTDDNNNIYVSSTSQSTNFPIVNGFQTALSTVIANDAVLLKMDNNLSSIIWSSFLGGNGEDAALSIQLDMDNNVFVAGGTTSYNFPTTTNSYDTTYNGGVDGWVAHIDLYGDSIINATYTGTSSYDQVYFIDLDDSEEVYLYGQTSGDFPKTAGVYSNTYGRMFVQKLSYDLSTIRFSTAFGSNSNPDVNLSPTAFMVNDCDNLYMAGWGGVTNSNFGGGNTLNMPVSDDAWQPTTSGSDFYLMVLTSDASEFLYGTYLGGNLSKTHVDGGTSRFDKQGIVYHSVCAGCAANNVTNGATSDFPTTEGAWSSTNNSGNCNNAAFKFDLASLRARFRTNSIAFDNPGLKTICIPDPIVFENVSIGGEIFEWDFGDGVTESRTDTTHVVHEYTSPGTYVIRLKAIDQNTCIGIDEASVSVVVFEGNFLVNDGTTLCSGDEFKLEAYGGSKYYWYNKGVTFSSYEQFPIVHPVDTTTYYVYIEDELKGCGHLDSVLVNVIPEVKANFIIEQNYNCFEIPEINILNESKNASTYLWDFGDGTTSTEELPQHQYDSGVYNVNLRAINDICSDETSYIINMAPVKVYNVISPVTSIGVNDYFFIESPFSIQLILLNRWGKVVFESDNYENNWNAEGEPAGVYFYNVSIDGKQQCKGWVQVFK